MKKFVLLAAFIYTSAFAAVPEPVTIFGLPLGGKLKTMPKECPFSKIGLHSYKHLCWVGPPFVYRPTGDRLGSIQLPNKDTFPKWAAFGTFKAQITKNAELESLEVESTDGKAASEIEQSIKARFGQPTVSNIYTSKYPSATWNADEVSIKLLCNGTDLCHVTFLSKKAKDDYDKEMEARRKAEEKRAVSP